MCASDVARLGTRPWHAPWPGRESMLQCLRITCIDHGGGGMHDPIDSRIGSRTRTGGRPPRRAVRLARLTPWGQARPAGRGPWDWERLRRAADPGVTASAEEV